MKILLDECVTKRIKKYLSEFDVFTINELGWTGKKNGELIALCLANNIEVLLTIDKNLEFQQNIKKYNITLVVLNSKTSKVEELVKFIPALKTQLTLFKGPGVLSIDIE